VNDLEADISKRRSTFQGFGTGPQRHADVFKLLIQNGGGKCRFRVYWRDEHLRLALYDLEVGSPEFMKNFKPPTEIQCLQGSGGDQRIDLNACIAIPPDFDKYPFLWHGTYVGKLRYILTPTGTLKPGGDKGSEARGNVYFSMVDPRRYEPNYKPEFCQFREVRKEPTPFRGNINCAIKLDYRVIHEVCGTCYEAGSLAAFAQYDTEIPFEAMLEVSDKAGWVIFDKPMIAGGNSSQPNARPGDNATANLLASVKLSVVQDKAKKSYTKRSNIQDRRPEKAFSDYCKEILNRIKRASGIKIEDNEICHFDTFPEGKMFRARAERDIRFRAQLRKAMRETYPTCIGDVTSINDWDGLMRWADYMNEHAIQNKEHVRQYGNPNPKSQAQRDDAPPKWKVAAEGSSDAAGNSIPLNTAPGYDAARRQAELQNVQARVQTAYRQDDRRVPSDGYGCHICWGNHYARDCWYLDRGYGPY